MDELQENLQKLKNLFLIKSKLNSELHNIITQINKTESIIYKGCNDLHNGHKWKTCTESCMYGETFYVCEICGMNK